MSSKLNVVKVIMNTAKCYTLTNNIMIILLKVTEKSEFYKKKYFFKILYCYSRLYQEFGVHIQA